MNFSVLMSVYQNDNPEHLKEAINSILKQTVKPNEFVIVLDGPVPEEIQTIIKEYENNDLFKVVPLENNVGLGNALREGLKYCSNSIVARMDSDDISLPNRFELQVKEFEQDENLSVVGGYIEEFTDSVEHIISTREVPLTDEEIKKEVTKRNPFNHMTVMFRKEAVIEAGNYIEYKFYEDYYLWIRMILKNNKFKNIGQTLVYARIGNGMYKRRGGYSYFKQGMKIQKFMLENNMISFSRFLKNEMVRFLLQVLSPNFVRAFIYKKFARKKVN